MPFGRKSGRNGEHWFVFLGQPRPSGIAVPARRKRGLRMLGVDPGLHLTGYGMIETAGRTIRVVEAGVIRTDTRAPLADRLVELYSELRDVIAEWRPGAIALEDVFAHPAFPRTGILIGHVCGVINIAAAERRIPVETIPPAVVKRALVTSGRADKRQIQRMVRVLLMLDRDPVSHVGDALALALVGLSRHGVPLRPAAPVRPSFRPNLVRAPA